MKNFPDKNLIIDAVNKFSDTVFCIAFQYVKNRPDAEDILQEVFLKLLKIPPATKNDSELKAWLIRVTINKCKDFLRANKRRRAVLQTYSYPKQPDFFNEVLQSLDKLHERDRNALYLHYYEGYTAREIAEILGDNERAVTKRICRAREKLKAILEE